MDINPIAEERITLAEYMKESEAYLDQKEIEKLAVDLDNFSYEYDTYEYKDIVENREEQVKKITEDILNKKTGCLKDWLVEVSEESDIDRCDNCPVTALPFRKCRNLFYLYQTIRTGTARSYDQFLCSRVHGVPGHG